jgi:hypothetical protein
MRCHARRRRLIYSASNRSERLMSERKQALIIGGLILLVSIFMWPYPGRARARIGLRLSRCVRRRPRERAGARIEQLRQPALVACVRAPE